MRPPALLGGRGETDLLGVRGSDPCAVISDFELRRSGFGPDFFTGAGAMIEEPVSAAKADWIALPLFMGVSEMDDDGEKDGDAGGRVLSLAGRKNEGRGGGEYESCLLVEAESFRSGACIGRDPCLDLIARGCPPSGTVPSPSRNVGSDTVHEPPEDDGVGRVSGTGPG